MQNYHISILWIAYRIYVQFSSFFTCWICLPRSFSNSFESAKKIITAMSIRNVQYSGTWRQVSLYFTRSEKNEKSMKSAGKRRTSLGINLSHCQLPCMQFSRKMHIFSPPHRVVFWPHRNNLVFSLDFYNCMRPRRHPQTRMDGEEWKQKTQKMLFFSFHFLPCYFLFRNKLHFISANWIFAVVILSFFVFQFKCYADSQLVDFFKIVH